MTDFNQELTARLRDMREQGLERRLRDVDSPQGTSIEIAGRKLLNFSSNDYLGLANHPALKEAAIKAVEKFGAGSGASRLISGSLTPHRNLEDRLAAWKGCEAALAFSSGYATSLGVVSALMDSDDVVILDKLVHASIVDAARLSGAKLRVFKHNDLNDLERILKWADNRQRTQGKGRILIATESVFSMDGDLAPLLNLVELKERHGAWLLVDEAHATGLFGEKRTGLIEAHELSGRVDIQMGTLGKALGSAGGFICGSRALVDYLVHRARSFVFSTAPVPAAAAAAAAAVELVAGKEGEQRCGRLWALVDLLKSELINVGWQLGAVRSPIVPLIFGAERRAIAVADGLRERGVFVPAIRYPTVARGAARLRVTLSATHTAADVAQLVSALSHEPKNTSGN